ncbi:8832_t:CDS:2 [Scutellospora calospora]|uniref:8832_t:CDS:1 n=1 Tax=Scutellospora calospora TaxID=85575 RepID=A0ACA9JXU6_9GLOM|nr:8832_t:CDS:2 [Scutellospora calospora]
MPSTSEITDDSGKQNSDSFLEWVPQHSLSGQGHNLSKSMSLHLHSTSRRIFIGPTPANWNYQKNSLWFSKSEKAVHHGTRKKKTFRANTDVTVEEPQEMEYLESDMGSSVITRDVFYTPSEDVKDFPVTPPTPHNPHFNSKKSKPQSLQVRLFLEPNIEENDGDDISSELSKSSIDHVLNDQRLEENSAVVGYSTPVIGSDAGSFNTPTYTPAPGTVLKEDCILIRIERVYHSGVPKIYNDSTSKKYLTHSVGWREYIVKLKSDKKFCVDKLSFASTTRLSLYSTVDYTLALSSPSEYGMKVFIFRLKTQPLSIEWYRAFYNLLRVPSIKPVPTVCAVAIPDLDVRIQIPLDDEMQAFNITAEEITKIVLDELSGINEWEDVLNEWLQNSDMRLCWKRYDRLEWITHQLQLRCTKHYPTSVTLPDEIKLQEPPPVEGYLIRVTNDKGRKNKSKRLYFSSHDYYLFFMKPSSASPPPPPTTSESGTGEEDKKDKLNNKQPIIYAVSPHVHGQQHITAFIKADSKRRVKQIINAYGFINLIDVIEAYSKTTRKEWVKCLDDLIKYWKVRLQEDIKTRINVYKANKFNDCDDDHANRVDGFHEHWDNFRTFADPTIWHWCILNGCRSITKSGLLYQKIHHYGTFIKHYHVLTRGYLLFYQLYTRSIISGQKKPRSYYRRKGIINLLDCYVYSGHITDYDLPYSLSTSHQVHNGMHKLPKLYNDGMYCFDDDGDCTFVIWQSEKRCIIGRKGTINLEIRKKTKLDSSGKIWIFRARSRSEREEWVLALNTEIERCLMEHNE